MVLSRSQQATPGSAVVPLMEVVRLRCGFELRRIPGDTSVFLCDPSAPDVGGYWISNVQEFHQALETLIPMGWSNG